GRAGGRTATEQQAVVRGQPVVVDQVVHVADRGARGYQLPGQVTQGSGGADIAADRQEAPPLPGKQFSAVGVAADDQLIRAHLTQGGADADAGGILTDGADPGLTVNQRPGLRRCPCQAGCIFQRVQAAATAVHDSGLIVCTQQLVQLAPVMEAEPVIAQRFELLLPDAQPGNLPRPVGHQQYAGLQVAIDPVALGPLLNKLHTFKRQLPHPQRIVPAQLLFEQAVITGQPRIDLAAVTPGTTPARLLRLQHYDPAPGFGQLQRSGQAGVTAADHAYIRLLPAAQRVINGGFSAGAVPGVGQRHGAGRLSGWKIGWRRAGARRPGAARVARDSAPRSNGVQIPHV